MGEFINGIQDYFGASRLIWRNHLWRWLIIPGFISLLYFPAVLWFCWMFADDSARYLQENWLPAWINHPVIAWALVLPVWIGLLYYGFTVYRNLIMIIYSPVLGIVSERTEQHLTHIDPAARPKVAVWKGMLRGIKMSLTSLALSALALVVCVAMLLIPIVGGLLMAICLPLSQMFLAGQGFMDPMLERKSYGVRGSLKFCWSNRMRTIGCGAGFTLLTMIPIVGWFVAPGFGIVAGTRSAVHLVDHKFN